MKKLLIFVLFLIGCSEEHEIVKKICSPFRMTISDAIPVQFWVNGVETYNQKEVCGITPACFCQPFNCDDEIRIQFQDSRGGIFYLVIYDSSNTEITRLAFSEVVDGAFQLSFVPSEIDICDEQIRFEIILIEIQPLSLWINYDPSPGTAWTLGANPTVNLTTTGSEYIYGTLFTAQNQERTFSLDIGITAPVDYVIFVQFLDENFNIVGTVLNTDQPFVGQVTSSPSSDSYYIMVTITNAGAVVGSADISTFSLVPEYTLAASSDCLDIRESHECTALIRYVNSKDFADIEYTDFSPSAEFYIRVPAVFFHLRPQTEQEDFETSGQTIVRLRNEIKKRHLLELGYMPDYMHLKLMLILAHDTVEIEGEQWVQRDAYEIIPPSNKRYPLKMANVILTQQGYIKRNIL